MVLEEEFKQLQNKFAFIDMMTRNRPRTSINGFTELLLVRLSDMKIKIYQEDRHNLPHIHIDYGKQHHVASYSIESGKRLDGDLSRKYDRDVSSWLADNREKILEIWNALKKGESHESLVAELVGNV